MKVAFFTPTASGGHARFTQCMMEGIRQAAQDIDLVLCTSEDLAPSHRNTSYRIAAVLPALRPRKAFGSYLSWALSRLRHYPDRDRLFLEWVRAEKPDIVHLQEWFPFTAQGLVRALQREGAKVVMSVHNLFRHENLFPGHSWLQSVFEKRGWRQCDRLIVMSAGLATKMAAVAKLPADRIHCVPHILYPDGTDVAVSLIETKRAQANVLLFGAVRHNKGAEVFIDALARTPELRGLIAGYCPDPAYAAALAQQIARTGARVEMRNRFYAEEDIPWLFAEASVAAFPYTGFSSQSGALYMAVAHETPVVGSRVGGLGETIEDERLGLTVIPNNVQDLALALRKIHQPADYQAAILAAKRLRKVSGLDVIGAQIASIYRGLL